MLDLERRTRGGLVVGLLLAAAAVRADDPAGAHFFELKSGRATYTLVHKFHQVQGTSQKLEGRARVLPDGTAQVQVRAPLASFDSGNSNRDAHMREATHELQHPHVTVKGTLTGVRLPLAGPLEQSMQATVELNGERHTLPVQVKLAQGGDKLHATYSFAVSLDAFKIERPELMLIKVEDAVKMDGELVFEESK